MADSKYRRYKNRTVKHVNDKTLLEREEYANLLLESKKKKEEIINSSHEKCFFCGTLINITTDRTSTLIVHIQMDIDKKYSSLEDQFVLACKQCKKPAIAVQIMDYPSIVSYLLSRLSQAQLANEVCDYLKAEKKTFQQFHISRIKNRNMPWLKNEVALYLTKMFVNIYRESQRNTFSYIERFKQKLHNAPCNYPLEKVEHNKLVKLLNSAGNDTGCFTSCTYILYDDSDKASVACFLDYELPDKKKERDEVIISLCKSFSVSHAIFGHFNRAEISIYRVSNISTNMRNDVFEKCDIPNFHQTQKNTSSKFTLTRI